MVTEETAAGALERRAARHAALADTARLRIVDALELGDAGYSELGAALGLSSNLLAHHLRVLESAALITRSRSEGDGRRSYLRLVRPDLESTSGPEAALGAAIGTALGSGAAPHPARVAPRVLFVCSGNSARSQWARALWARQSAVPAVCAGTQPAERVSPSALRCAARHGLDLTGARPRHLRDVRARGDLIVTVCDRATEALGGAADLHWSVPRLAPDAPDATVDEVFAQVQQRVRLLVPHVRSENPRPTGVSDDQ